MEQKPRRKTFIDDPDYLRRWFLEKGHPFLVFKVADLMAMRPEDQELFLNMRALLVGDNPVDADMPEDELKRAMKACGFRGYVRIDVNELCKSFDVGQLGAMQAVCTSYRAVRENKYEPTTVEECDCMGHDPRCRDCSGRGKIVVMVEMSETETALAEGKNWDEVPGL